MKKTQKMISRKIIARALPVIMTLLYSCSEGKSNETTELVNTPGEPTIVITDLYFPPQDDDDNFDMIMGYGLPGIDVKAIILDITDAFRKPVADHPELWNDPTGPRDAGVIPIMQLNYIFNRDIPFAVSPFHTMRSITDKMLDIPGFQQQGVELLIKTLRESEEPVQILSFGSSRVLALAYNREPELMKEKTKMIHLNMGFAHPEGIQLGEIKVKKSIVAEWNVKLDVHSFVRLMQSDLPIALYPCGSYEGMGKNNTYWELHRLTFIAEMDEKLQRYMDYFFRRKNQYDFLRAMDMNELPDTSIIRTQYPDEFHMWTTDSWLQAANLVMVREGDQSFALKQRNEVNDNEAIVSGHLLPCTIEVGNDGKFVFSKISDHSSTNFYIYERSDPALNEKAFNQVIPALYKGFEPGN
ncbi:MAG: hypothetical protein K9J30_10205 [Bacteroidales bacterium]|nr:hypothetical protein [Bacteroidales bacterium]MCF8347000.1 hypothetical protein [Bacteroidales bacterium]